ncbi:Dual-specificity RNA methyltransferase RlmN [Hondaea fermentalgiana]|uniref:Dual-specificity RNA methyltransferase RlmN n=1 Tax=Hondaea fermentalgiana TaxID=2315210 RepID=A0A2R5G2G8_9STRA|nr:Dual-specificity RNA methyltransferase RlmN [Hondaea fermentalgiana]|eukprot:GBG24519.1 Dual-specificity RNA methyltransferase RlmN [Hondaea fermentalgiana]
MAAAQRRRQRVKCLLDEDAVREHIIQSGLFEEEKAAKHAANIAHLAFLHENRQLRVLEAWREQREAKDDEEEWSMKLAMERCKVEQEFSLRDAPNVPKVLHALFDDWNVLACKLVHIHESDDFVTSKLLIELEDGNQVEAVVLRHNKRTTLCVSSQVGCKMKCTFCATGTLGERANLTSGEIQDQLILANRYLKSSREPRTVSNVVLMGMGEPLNNYNAVVSACQAMSNTARFSMSPSRITLSTVGVVNRMKTLARDLPGVSLALSLHAPNQELRQQIIPTASAYPLDKIMEAVQEHLETGTASRRKRTARDEKREGFVMIEYILLSGVNDTPAIAHELAALLGPLKDQVKLNLIPYNPIFNAEGLAKTFKPPTSDDVETFQRILQKDHGIFTTVRVEMGQDVNGACGQLACVSEQARDEAVDIEDLLRERQANKLYDRRTGANVNKKRRPAHERRATLSQRIQKHKTPLAIASALVLTSALVATYFYATSSSSASSKTQERVQ